MINEGGQVRVGAMAAKHCTFMKFTGSGAADQYGFYLTSPNQTTLAPAMCITGRSSDIEVDRLDIYDHGYGFWVKEEGSCDPTMQYPNWRMNNMLIHDCRMRNLRQEGIYAGSTAPNGERAVYCNGVATYPLPIRLGNVKIYNNIIDRTGRGGIQLASCDVGANEIYGNTVTNNGTEYTPSQGNGIVLGGYTTAYVHDNVVNNTFSTGIFSLGAGEVRIENNRVDNSGSLDGRTANGSASIMVDTRLTIPVMNTKFYVKNNVLGTNTDFGIRVYDTYPTFELGNVICGNTKTTGGDATYYVQGATNWINCTAPQNASPTANAGPLQTITLPATLTLSGSGTDRDGTIVAYQWAQVIGPSNVNFATPNAASTTVGNLVAGTYTFKLTVTDNGGATGSANVTITVNAAGTGGSTSSGGTTVKIEAENFSAQSGIQTENCSEGGQNIGWQDNNDWMDYSVNLASAGSYNLSFRVASMFTGATFQLRNSAGSVLATVTVPNTGSFQGWTTVNANVSLPAGQQTLRIVTTAANGGWNFNYMDFTQSAAAANQAPTANAGAAQTITLPTASVTLSGSGTDADGSITAYQWSQVSGPANASFSNANAAQTSASNLVQGTYTFRLKVTDNGGLSATSDVSITVNPAPATGGGGSTGTTLRIEAENYTAMSGIQLEGCSEGGQNVAWQDNNDWMDYSANIASAGTYTVNFRVASMFTGATFQLRNASGSVLATVTVPNSGSFQSWRTVSASVTLPAGQQTLRIVTTNAAGGWNLNWLEIVGGGSATPPPPPAATTTRIEAENYTAMSGIQKENTSDVGGGQNVGWQDDNDWMDYPVSVATSGSFAVNFRVASMFTGAQFQLRKADGTVLTTVTVPNTGSFQSWQTVTANVTLPAGAQTLRVFTNKANGGWNFNWWELQGGSATPPPPPAGATTQRIEAESFASQSGIQTEGCSEGGQNVGWQDNNDWMDYSVNLSAAGTYTMNFRVASMFTGAQFQVRSASGTVLATITVPNTGSFQSWQTVSAQVALPSGQQTLRIVTTAANGGWNFNWFEIASGSGTSAAATREVEVIGESHVSVYPNPVSDRFLLQVNNDLTGTMTVQLVNMSGAVTKQFQVRKAARGASQTYLSIGSLPRGEYVLSVKLGEWTKTAKLIKQ